MVFYCLRNINDIFNVDMHHNSNNWVRGKYLKKSIAITTLVPDIVVGCVSMTYNVCRSWFFTKQLTGYAKCRTSTVHSNKLRYKRINALIWLVSRYICRNNPVLL